MPDKPIVPPVTQKQISLTDLAEINETLSRELAGHTAARNYLWNVATGQAAMPIVNVRPLPDSGLPTMAESHGATIDMATLSSDAVENLLSTMLDHEERTAFDTWRKLATNANLAVETIKKVQEMREAEMRKRQQNAENVDKFPPTIPLPQGER
jgi:hypothetical protein